MERRILHCLVNGDPVGVFEQHEDGTFSFEYTDGKPTGLNLSVNFPRSDGAIYRGRHVNNWLDGLLPDNADVRKGMAELRDLPKPSTYWLLHDFGLDLPGAVQIVPEERVEYATHREGSYSVISRSELGERLDSIREADRTAKLGRKPWVSGDENWSLGGNQGKLALFLDDGIWHTCSGSFPSNVIVKPGIARLDGEATVECIVMNLAASVGLDVSRTWIERFDGVDALVTERYDRITKDEAVYRLHQEDLCQALGCIPSKKYVREGGPTSSDIAWILEGSSEAEQDEAMFARRMIFEHLVGGIDGHAKNYSILHSADGTYRLAPSYDMSSVLPYIVDGETYRTAIPLGHEARIGLLKSGNLDKLASTLGMDREAMRGILFDVAARLYDAVEHDIPQAAVSSCYDEIMERMAPKIKYLCDYTSYNVERIGTRPRTPRMAGFGLTLTRDGALNIGATYDVPISNHIVAAIPSSQQNLSATAASQTDGGMVWVDAHIRGNAKVRGYWRKRPKRR